MKIGIRPNMLNFMRNVICQNLRYTQNVKMGSIAYQFRANQPFYYPNRQKEKQRIMDQFKTPNLIAEEQEKKNLPKDHYYKILGVNKNATPHQIKTAYYALAKVVHPDASNAPRESKRFQEISNAYHILSDEAKRREYDNLGVVKDETTFLNQTIHANMRKGIAFQHDKTTREELIQQTTGEPRLDLTFLEAVHGRKKILDLRFLKKCGVCNGRVPRLGAQSQPEKCRKCAGTGQLSKETLTYSGTTICDQCEGRCVMHKNHCAVCNNRGIIVETVKVTISVPSGVKTGDIITVENPKTNLPVNYRIYVQDSDNYKRNGNDVFSVKYLTISQAILGGNCKVRGIYEELDLKIEPGTESHSKVVVKGKGIRTAEGIGDHIITFKITIPQQLTMKQRQLIMALSKTEDTSITN